MRARTRKTLKFCDIYLASASPRRAELIKKIPWLRATVFPSGGQEEPYDGADPAKYACRLAKAKALNVLSVTGGVVLGADTIVTAEGRVLGKPHDARAAEDMFRFLCGRTHEVITGYCLASRDKIAENFVKTYVTFGAFDDKIVYNYIKSGSPFDKAGGYGIQDELLAPLIAGVEGDLDNVIGLPTAAVEKTAEEFFGWRQWK